MTGSNPYRTIKSLVLDYVHKHGGHVDYDPLTAEVRKHFPASKWKPTHWAWYRSQMLQGRFKDLLSESERVALAQSGRSQKALPVEPVSGSGVAPEDKVERGPLARDPETKRVGDALLNHVRLVISLAAGEDVDKRFKLNRWVFSRLLQDEIRIKRPIKQGLWDGGMRTGSSHLPRLGSSSWPTPKGRLPHPSQSWRSKTTPSNGLYREASFRCGDIACLR